MNSEGSVAAFEWLNSMYEDGLLDRGSNIDGGLLLSAFQNGDAQMAISGPWALSGFREAGVNYGIAPIPTGTEAGRPFSGVRGFMINKFSKNQLLAQTFLQEFVATDATMKQIYDSDPRPPAWLPLAATIEDRGHQGHPRCGCRRGPHAQHPGHELGVAGVWRCDDADQQRHR